jgi:NADPH-dependent 2,4-dienoyl-CoA reductase/sulfur reductase-like enzyme
MPEYTYLIVGGGMAAHATVDGIRKEDKDGSIGIVTAEEMIPYDRPPLSKDLWTSDEMEGRDVLSDVLKRDDVRVHVDTRITTLDPEAKRLTDEDGVTYDYDKLLLATGSRPRRLPFDDGSYDIIYFRTLRDYYALRHQAEENRRIGVIGGGFIGSELAYALTEEGNQVAMFFPQAGVAAEVLPEAISQKVTDIYRAKGVQVLEERLVTTVEYDNDDYIIVTDKADRVEAEVVVAGVGVIPNTALAEGAGLAVDDGIRVNEHLQTTNPDIYSAGDVTRFYSPTLDEWIRVEHEDNATTQGEMAGRNMAGASEEYDYMPFFYSDMFDMGYEAVGKLDSDLNTTINWRDDEQTQAVVVYRDNEDVVRGVLMWNVFGELDSARDLLGKPISEADIKQGEPLNT